MNPEQKGQQENKRIRTFIAVDVNSALAEKIAALLASFAKTRADVRWVRTDGLHITLKFLGPTREADLPSVQAAMSAVADHHAPWQIELRGVGAFPSLKRPRVLWVGVRDGGQLTEVARELDQALAPLGFAPEERAFQPHLTLGRFRSLHRWDALEEAIKPYLDEPLGASEVTELILYESDLRPGGAVYTRLCQIPLGKKKGETA